MTRRTDRQRIAELEAANRKLAAEVERLRAYVAVAQVLARETMLRRINGEFAERGAGYEAGRSFRQYAMGLHVYGGGAVRSWSSAVVAP
jgi:hypothetical protein